MTNTIKIFCYGTLQEKSVQMQLINRTVSGKITSIENYIVLRDYLDVTDGIEYPRVVAFDKGCVYGTILEFTTKEVEMLDEYETDMYERINIITKCGEIVQIYMPTIQ